MLLQITDVCMNFFKEGKQMEIKNISKLIPLFFTFLTDRIKTEQNIPSHLELNSKNVRLLTLMSREL